MTKKAYFEPNLAIFRPKILILMGGSKRFSTHVTEKPPRHLVLIVFWWGIGSNGPKMPIFGQKASFGSNLAVYGPKIGTHVTENPPRHLVLIVFFVGYGVK